MGAGEKYSVVVWMLFAKQQVKSDLLTNLLLKPHLLYHHRRTRW